MSAIYIQSAVEERVNPLIRQLETLGYHKDDGYIEVVRVPCGREVLSERFFNLKASPTWRDDHTGLPMTWGQLSCFWGHVQCWKKIAKHGSAFVLEDDAKLVSSLVPPVDSSIDFVYQHWQARNERNYNWSTAGYWLSQRGATLLLGAIDRNEVIPTDEFIPHHLGTREDLNPNVRDIRQAQSLSLKWQQPSRMAVEATSGDESTTHSKNGIPLAIEFETVVIGTDRRQCERSLESLERLGYKPVLLGDDHLHWDTSGRGGMEKLEILDEYLGTRNERITTFLMLLDGYDTEALIHADFLLEKFLAMNASLVIGGETSCWPPGSEGDFREYYANFGWPQPRYTYPYPNSGCVITDTRTWRNLLEFERAAIDDDQAFFHRIVAQRPTEYRVDTEAYLVGNLARAQDHWAEWRDPSWPDVRLWQNVHTKQTPCIVHANGPDSSLDIEGQAPPPAALPEEGEGIDNQLADGAFRAVELGNSGILRMPFLNRETCEQLVRDLENPDLAWKPLSGDAVPGDELRVSEFDPDMLTFLVEQFGKNVGPLLNERWFPAKWTGIKDAFFIRYSPDRQPALRLHNDISNFSFSVRIRCSCGGGVLEFPRQNVNDYLVDDGDILVWPSRVTHPHRVTPVTKGTRISLVIWTEDEC